jgi:preprotein translocase subunit SecG
MDIVRYIVIGLEVIASLALILVVLFQSGKESGLSGALAGSADTYLSKSKNASLDKMLAASTKWVALAWIVLTLILSLI